MKIITNKNALLIVCLTAGHFLFAQIDKKATKETKNLYRNLKTISKNHILFGHQHALEYGHGWSNEPNRSDVKSVTGSHPAVVGIDFSDFSGRPDEQIQQAKETLRKNVIETYERGGVTTVSWHFNNPASEGGFYWKDGISKASMALIKPGGSHHDQYKEILKSIADFAHSVKAKNGTLAPMIFRPYHEFDGDWFWWGKSHTSREDFIAVWQFTVSYLKDTLGVHNFIYAFSPDNQFNSEAAYLERYPGDNYVDMLGMDDYGDFGRDEKYDLTAGLKKLKIFSDLAIKKKKLAAFTETGLESIPNEKWWTEVLLKTLKSQNLQLAYVLVWRNDSTSPTHYYAPFPEQLSEKDFVKFHNDSFTLFEKDLKNIYDRKFKLE
ncbi:glycoside hydrolase family 26 protein [Flavobacterium quisquiliarum]|uniref:Mannan endo-1,4-beta-mannosidase n=1 Tax=Flavobacterium quisquiliarum TaxID=1834436 RepID=A0ABV8W7B4_9FLAO|nr:glycosyl hydrolase [Flavobacterium quisquiliarum]MBW1654344.1 beta-mannosidase [Flavobacterium quisquiliarum]NWL03387.1 beta-mannosidase [Flavobacterium collinsii]